MSRRVRGHGALRLSVLRPGASRPAALLAIAAWLLLAGLPAGAQAPAAAPGARATQAATPEFTYLTRPGDTLIGLSARLLREPRRWRELQSRNRIVEPRRMPRGSAIRIPYHWLRISAQGAKVLERVGSVQVDGREVSTGAVLEAGTLLETGAAGSVTLELVDGTVLVLQPSSRLRLERLQRIDGVPADEAVLELERGRIETRVKQRGDMGRFEIRTPAAVTAVRGTEFRASYTEAGAGAGAGATTETLDGTVAVNAAGTGVAVRAGFGTRAERGRAPAEPVPLLPAPLLEGLAALNERAALRWQFAPVPGAAAYRHQLARDAQFRTLVSDAVTSTPASGIDDLPDGRYWLRVRAIDATTIEGYDVIAPLEQRRRLDAPTARAPIGAAPRIGASTRFDWDALAGASGYRFQLAREPRFESPLQEQTIAATQARAGVADGAGVDLAQLSPGPYFWRVAAIDAAGIAGHWGEAQSFVQKPAPVVADPVPVAAEPGSRADGAAVQAFRWNATDPGQRFEWQVARDAAFLRIVRSGRSETPELALAGLAPGRHYLRLRTLDADGFEAPFGEARRFHVPLPRWVWFVTPAILLIPAL